MSETHDTPFILPLDDAAATLETVGGKGASLARMAAAGLPAPAGFHATTAAYRRFVAENDLQREIIAAVADADPDNPASLDTAAALIQALFATGTVGDDLAGAIRRAYAALGGGDLPVAVRSSATAEDLPDLSFAGQQETYLNMRGDAAVVDAVTRCWASLWTARAIGYRARHGVAPADVSLAVVVQTLVPADAAGILFTANPLNGRRDQMMINAAWGLGEAIVGGAVTPDTLVLDKTSGTMTEQQINEKRVMTVRTPDGTHEEPVPADRQTVATITPAQAKELVELGGRIERLYRQPMDVEWALHDDHLAIVQARPITALPEPQAIPPLDWRVPDPRALYARASIVEMLPDPLTPLFADLGTRAVTEATIGIFADLLRQRDLPADWIRFTTINGYAYYGYRFTLRMLGRMLWSFLTQPSQLRNLGARRWREEFHPRYVRTVAAWEAKPLDEQSASALLAGVEALLDAGAVYYTSVQMLIPVAATSETMFTSFYNRAVRQAGDPPAQTFLLGFDSAPIRADKSLHDLATWCRAQPHLADTLAAIPAQSSDWRDPERAPAGVDAAMWRAWCDRFRDHLRRYGRMIYGLDFAKPVPADDPAPLFDTLKFYLRGSGQDPHRRQAEATDRREAATNAVTARLDPVRRAVFRRLLRWAQTNAPPREDALADEGLAWPLMRRMLFTLGRRLVAAGAITDASDVFWLTEDELRRAVTDLDARRVPVPSHAAAIRARRVEWRARKAVTPPALLPERAKMWGMDLARWMPMRMDEQRGDTIAGVGASAGAVTAVARVLHGPEDFGTFQPGEILVASITTPAWTPLFALAAAVVTDVGGPLSHGSIVAREYHIPAVLGTGVATKRIETGQTIRVDGDAGTVTLLGESDAGEATSSSPDVAPVRDERSRGKKIARAALVAASVAGAAIVWRTRRRGHADAALPKLRR